AEKIGADVEKAKRAARLAKADLTTGVVGEFPELQGVMGRYYALHDGEDADVAEAIRDHYKPLGPNDAVPTSKVSIAVALADKLDQLIGFFSIGEKPTGSGDPFALRRAALGVTRSILANSARLWLSDILYTAKAPFLDKEKHQKVMEELRRDRGIEKGKGFLTYTTKEEQPDWLNQWDALHHEALAFLADRLKVALREKGTRHDLIDAVFSLGNEDDLVR